MPVIRTNHSKWYLSKEKYGEDLYPHYCSGIGLHLHLRCSGSHLGTVKSTLPLESAEDCSRDRDARVRWDWPRKDRQSVCICITDEEKNSQWSNDFCSPRT
ncbi:hypothetical protein CEXT_291501 [Caerostris extrusa]|uniref:Uncharacterized protein n=1 Tax=Caerostris extrusa TaxID=172846 RepID=A0AAV4XBN7_CAEEX|nr:hypothetical protein CEXT_291501 [Caerostris extrusa]